MKKFISIASVTALLAVGAQAVTNVSKSIDSRSLPADAFRPVINDRLYDVVNTDIPAIVADINSKLGTSGSATLNSLSITGASPLSVASTQVVFSAATATMTTATNTTPTASIQVRLNGTNYLLKLFPN